MPGPHPGSSRAAWAAPDLSCQKICQKRILENILIEMSDNMSERILEDMSIEMSNNMSEKNVRRYNKKYVKRNLGRYVNRIQIIYFRKEY